MMAWVPRIARRREWEIEAWPTDGELVRAELAHDDRAGSAEFTDANRILFGDVVDQDLRVRRGWQPGDVNNVLDSNGNAVQRAAAASGRKFLFGGFGGIQRGIGVEADERMQSWLQLFDALQQRSHEFGGRQGAGGVALGDFGGGKPVKGGHRAGSGRIGGHGSAAGLVGYFTA